MGGGVMTSLISEISMRSYFGRVFESLTIPNVFESIVKSIVFAFLVAAIGCFRGIECENDAKGVGNATTSSVVSGIFLIILADTLVTFIYPQFMHIFGISY
jgi:phospholipid/cholesterol/gamma-HCH transport system permease protein